MAERGELGVEVEDIELVEPTLVVVVVMANAAALSDAEGEETLGNGGCCCPLVNMESSSYTCMYMQLW